MADHAYDVPYPDSEYSLAVQSLSDIPDGRFFLVKMSDGSYWRGVNVDDTYERDEAYVWNKEEIENSGYSGTIINKMIQILPELESDEMTPVEAAEVNDLLNEPLMGEVEKPEAPSEVILSPGQVLFNTLKSNTKVVTEDWKADKASVIKFVRESLINQYEVCTFNLEHELRIDEGASLMACCIMLQGNLSIQSQTEYTQFVNMVRAAAVKLSGFTKTIPSETKTKLSRAIERSQGF